MSSNAQPTPHPQEGAIVNWKSRRGNTQRGVVETPTTNGAWVVRMTQDGYLMQQRVFRVWDTLTPETSN